MPQDFPMKLFEIKKLEELLATNWSKFISYKTFLDIVANNIPLYAPNWSTIQSSRSIKVKTINFSKFEITKNNLIKIWANFEIPFENKIAVGTMEVLCDLNGNYEISRAVGNFYL
jgi:hypothetical protein